MGLFSKIAGAVGGVIGGLVGGSTGAQIGTIAGSKLGGVIGGGGGNGAPTIPVVLPPGPIPPSIVNTGVAGGGTWQQASMTTTGPPGALSTTDFSDVMTPWQGPTRPGWPTATQRGRAPAMAQGGMPQVAVEPVYVGRATCPPGYVTVTDPASGAKACVLKEVARKYFGYRPRRRPPISAGDWRKLQVSARVEKKAKEIAQKAGFTCRTRGSGVKKK